MTLQAPVRRSAAVLILGGWAFLHGQTSTPAAEPISTDRPSFANSSVVVPKGAFQAENGFQATHSQRQYSFDGPETSLRFGVADKTELRLFAPNYFWDVPPESSSGFGDLTIGVKRQLGPVRQFDVSVIVFLSLPSGSDALSSHGYDPGVQLAWSRKLSAKWTAAGQLAVYSPTQGNTRNVTGESTLLFDRQFTHSCDGFAEYVGDFPQHGGPRHLMHTGGVCKLSANHQIDVHAGVGLSSAAADHFIGIGYSFRFQAIRH